MRWMWGGAEDAVHLRHCFTPYDEFEVDDGISHQVEGGLKLVIGYEMQEDNSCRLSASIE